MSVDQPKVTALLAAAGAEWEAEVTSALGRARCVARRCLDVHDLLALAATGVGEVAVVAAELTGLDADAVRRLQAARLAVIGVVHDSDVASQVERLRRIGIGEVLVQPDPAELVARVQSIRVPPLPEAVPEPDSSIPASEQMGRVVVVWGPAGAPGRSTTAAALATLRAAGGRPVVLIDADPRGGTIGQDLGILDEVSGLLAAARRANDGSLTPDVYAGCRRALPGGVEVLTGLPRPDRWMEVRPGVIDTLVHTAALGADVVIDAGDGLDDDERSRDRITLEALASADEVVVVGGAEPAGLVRLSRGLMHLKEMGHQPAHVVVNRLRDSLGWERRDLVSMISGYLWQAQVHFVREDRAIVDRALVAGRSLAEMGESSIRADFAALTAAVFD